MEDYIPYISIKPDKLSFYQLPQYGYNRTRRQKANEVNLSNTSHNGIISYKANKRIKLAIQWLLCITDKKAFIRPRNGKLYKFKVNFITLTLSGEQRHSDQVIKSQLLNHFLQVAKYKWGVKNYVWRAETQQRGAIHFHILTDKYIAWSDLRTTWNRIQGKLGYVQQYFEKFGKSNPNSTDIHSIRKVKNLAAYISKYCTKASQYRSIDGKQWGLSLGLSKLKSAIAVLDSTISKVVDKIKELKISYSVQYDYCFVVYIPLHSWFSGNKSALDKILIEYLHPFRSLLFS